MVLSHSPCCRRCQGFVSFNDCATPPWTHHGRLPAGGHLVVSALPVASGAALHSVTAFCQQQEVNTLLWDLSCTRTACTCHFLPQGSAGLHGLSGDHQLARTVTALSLGGPITDRGTGQQLPSRTCGLRMVKGHRLHGGQGAGEQPGPSTAHPAAGQGMAPSL